LQVDGIWIRDPECILFRQFARADQRYAPGGQGFLFTAIVYSGAKSASVNRSDYFFSLDPERAAGRHLYPVWATLQAAEIQALVRDPDSCSSLRENPECRDGFEARAGSYGPLFRDPWFDGSNYEATIVATPSSGSSIQGEGTRSDLSDDTVAKLVSEFLENRNLTGEVTWRDYPMHTGQIGANEAPVDHLIGFQGVTPPIPTGNIRLVTAELAQEVDLSVPQTATQAGRQIWQFLYTDARGGVPTDFVTRHLILDPDIVCVWGRRGIALGTKPGAKARTESIRRLLDILTRVATVAEQEVVVLKRHLQGKCCDLHGSELLNPGAKVEHHRHFWRKRRKECHTVECQQNFDRLLDELYIQLADIAELQRQMAQPEGRFLYPFFQASRLDEILASVRESHNALSTRADNRTMRESLVKIQEVEENTDWMETIIIGVYLLELVNITSQPESRQHPWFLVSAWAGGLALASLAGWLGGRGRDRAAMQWAHRIARGMVIVWIAAIFFLGLFWTSFFPENKPVPPPSTIVVSGPQTNVDKPLTPEVKAPAANGLPGKPSEDSSAIPNHH
jgi:hypothetical protein